MSDECSFPTNSMLAAGLATLLLFNFEITLGVLCLSPKIFGLGLDLFLNKVTNGIT